jgi:hypothetical protein
MSRIEGACDFCEKRSSVETLYMINSEGGYGRSSMWACAECMRSAEDGSKLAQLREGIYAEDFVRRAG